MKELKKALTFDDILLVPAHSEVLPKQVSLTSKPVSYTHLRAHET